MIVIERAVRQLLVRLRRVRVSSQILALVSVLAATAVIGLFTRYAVSPAEGIIAALNGRLGNVANIDMTPRTVTSSYASFNYPEGLARLTSQPSTGPVVATYNWKHSDIQTWHLAISIVNIPSTNITDNNAYLFRKRNPGRFAESLLMVNGRTVPIMTDRAASGFSKVCFLKNGRYQAIVSLYGDDQSGPSDLQATLAMILGSWRWQTGS